LYIYSVYYRLEAGMARPKRSTLHEDMAEEIKAVARKQMSELGTAGLSLRAIARQMDITAPAIYNYFPSLEDLITALIVEAFTDLALAMEAAQADNLARGTVYQIEAVLFAYRQWAVDHPVDFQLIYGNPIPGYQAPVEVTGPLARRPFMGLFQLYARALQAGEVEVPEEYLRVPGSVSSYLADWRLRSGIQLPDALVCLLMSGWARIHGLVMLELFHHLQPVIGDPEALYRYEIRAYNERLGLAATEN
ncbi:MAG: TetR/AcrR family transcriptional regulator, partial [Anaerolineales bacterium]